MGRSYPVPPVTVAVGRAGPPPYIESHTAGRRGHGPHKNRAHRRLADGRKPEGHARSRSLPGFVPAAGGCRPAADAGQRLLSLTAPALWRAFLNLVAGGGHGNHRLGAPRGKHRRGFQDQSLLSHDHRQRTAAAFPSRPVEQRVAVSYSQRAAGKGWHRISRYGDPVQGRRQSACRGGHGVVMDRRRHGWLRRRRDRGAGEVGTDAGPRGEKRLELPHGQSHDGNLSRQGRGPPRAVRAD